MLIRMKWLINVNHDEEYKMKKAQIKQFNVLRIIFCVWVVLEHYYNSYFFQEYFSKGIMKEGLEALHELGYVPVSFFFSLSGFLIAYNYYDKSKCIDLITFLKKRLGKIYPLVLFSVLSEFLIIATYRILGVAHFKPLSFYSFIASSLLIRNGWFHEVGYNAYGSGTWYINVLVLCYIIWFLISKKFNHKYYVLSCLWMVLIGCFFYNINKGIPFLYQSSSRGYISFFMGCLLYELYLILDNSKGKVIKIILISVEILIVFLWIYKREYMSNEYLIFSIIAVPSVIFIILYGELTRKMLKWRIFEIFAKYTMSIYLTHTLIFEIYILLDQIFKWEIDFGECKTVAVVLVSAFVFGIYIHTFIESKLTVCFDNVLSKTKKRN